ncbi:hypothetical protein [Burkholderia gladioli]|uniref:hypothetical protein n=1 Tax=Burkholderia gladioli TaxID=28095 RepID=UPI0012F9F89B|nr:hypothetical protein [Burkholderia gladioli]
MNECERSMIVGSCRYIGAAITCRLIEEGLSVLLNDDGKAVNADVIGTKILGAGNTAIFHQMQCNITPAALADLTSTTTGREAVDIVSPPAGQRPFRSIINVANEDAAVSSAMIDKVRPEFCTALATPTCSAQPEHRTDLADMSRRIAP